MSIHERLAEIKERAEAATEGPWEFGHGDACHMSDTFTVGEYGSDATWVATWKLEDAEFIAHARTDIPALVAALEAVLAAHYAEPFDDEPSKSYCVADQRTAGVWPCSTVQAITDALGGEV